MRKLRAAAAAHARFFQDNPEFLELTVQDRAEFHGCGPESHREHHEQMIRKMCEILQQGIDAGEIRPVDPQQTTIALGSLLYGAAILGCHLRSVDVQAMTEHGVDIFLRGIGSESSRRTGFSDLLGSKIMSVVLAKRPEVDVDRDTSVNPSIAEPESDAALYVEEAPAKQSRGRLVAWLLIVAVVAAAGAGGAWYKYIRPMSGGKGVTGRATSAREASQGKAALGFLDPPGKAGRGAAPAWKSFPSKSFPAAISFA